VRQRRPWESAAIISGVLLHLANPSQTRARRVLHQRFLGRRVGHLPTTTSPFSSNLDIDVICDGRSPERLVKRKEEVNGICRNSKCDVHSDIPSYLSVVHVLANISHDMVRCQLALTPATVPAPPLQSLLPFPDAPLKKQVVLYLNAKMCHNRGGSFHNDGYCYVQGWLKSGCATVSGASIGNVSLGGVVPSGYSC